MGEEKIKKFAGQYIDTEKGNVVMFAKSNLNHVQCSYDGTDACQPVSSECCPRNDVVYNYLLSYPIRCSRCLKPNTKEAPIAWNFNKIFVDAHGHPWRDEILAAEEWDLVPYIDALLAEAYPNQFKSIASTPSTSRIPYAYVGIGVVGLVCFALVSIVMSLRIKRNTGQSQDYDACYLRVA
eukprot:CAMPEP_0169277026 /NCGR_PEP_ID=MMETSP1016-20121227/53409_1 /TAXON_ID=342587 /ORGANISM="Karlodinium micrum, Strain CCMP2283" /LENGTH=180 /DNA_ID=CAMNT_0009364367 /DNA_START=214 /DNA_END=757 /DNA_ORIENTATION=+